MSAQTHNNKINMQPAAELPSPFRIFSRGLTVPKQRSLDGVLVDIDSVLVVGDLVHMKTMRKESFSFYIGSYIKTDDFKLDEHLKNIVEVQEDSIEISFDKKVWISLDSVKGIMTTSWPVGEPQGDDVILIRPDFEKEPVAGPGSAAALS